MYGLYIFSRLTTPTHSVHFVCGIFAYHNVPPAPNLGRWCVNSVPKVSPTIRRTMPSPCSGPNLLLQLVMGSLRSPRSYYSTDHALALLGPCHFCQNYLLKLSAQILRPNIIRTYCSTDDALALLGP